MKRFNTAAQKLFILGLFLFSFVAYSQETDSAYIVNNYTKQEFRIPMRDGKTLFTSVYMPKDSVTEYPFLYVRTPYTVAPYGEEMRKNLGPSPVMMREKYIFVYQDVRGRFQSDGTYEDIRPHKPKKASKNDIDESSDTFDTIEWLLKNVPRNNGKVGMWGISYPGFYAAHGLIQSHPALKAVSPQAPIADWYMGDDFHHNGAFYLLDAFNFFRSFGKPRPQRTTTWPPGFEYPTPDAYRYLLEAGSLASIKRTHYGDTSKFWNDLFKHPNYDAFWKARVPTQYFQGVKPAVMTVGGWFDAEDLYGPLQTYHAVEQNNPSAYNILVMGPWFHGGWARSSGERLGNVSFRIPASHFYRDSLELTFFNYFLKGKGVPPKHEAYVFQTGTNEWKNFTEWPPKNLLKKRLFLEAGGKLSFSSSGDKSKQAYDEYVSDPNRPVPYIDHISNVRGREYMTDDQRFAWQRPDVLSYETEILKNDITVAGPITVTLYASTSGTDADFVVKVIDVFPDATPNDPANTSDIQMGGYQMLVRGDVMRARYRKSFERPIAMKKNTVEKVTFTLQDIHHTFKVGHRFMVQVQSSWFPLVDRNPQKFVNIYEANEDDFQKATHRIFRRKNQASYIEVGIIP